MQTHLSADVAPPAAFEWSPGRQVIAAIRAYQRGGWLRRKIAVLRWRFWSAVAGCEIPLNCKRLGYGIRLPHPNGIVVHPDAVIGENCTIFQQVTIGTRYEGSGVPTIGGHCEIGAGAKVLGAVVLRSRTNVGANAVVTRAPPFGTRAIVGANLALPR